MALLGHMSAEMSLRYGRLFDATVRTEYERALDLAKQLALTPLSGRTSLPLRDITGGKDWKDTPLLKSRMAGGFCLRHPPRAPAPTQIFVSTAPASTPSPVHCRSWPPNALMPMHSPATPNNEAGSPKPTDTNSSSHDSTD